MTRTAAPADSRSAESLHPRDGAGVFRRATAPRAWDIDGARPSPRIAVLAAGHVGPVFGVLPSRFEFELALRAGRMDHDLPISASQGGST